MKRAFRNLGIFTVRNRWFVIVACLLLMIPLMVAASQITMATGIDTYVPTESQEYQDFDRFSQHFSGSTIAVMLTGDDLTQLLQPDVLSSMEYVESHMAESARVISTIGPTLLIKQAVAQQSGTPALPQDLQTLLYIVTDPQTGEVRPEFESVFPDDSHAIIAIVLDGGLTMEEEEELADEAIDTVEAAGFSGVDVIVSGTPVLMGQIQEAMDSNLRNMLTLSVFIMLIILAVVFSVRGFFAWRWMPLAVVGLAIIYTFGIMGLIGIQMTMVTMAVFPILIGLGIDYAIQIHNRYDEEFERNRTVGGAMVKAVTHIGPAIGLALIAACLGFTALFFSPVPMVRDFGLMLIIGVAACYVLGVCFTSAVLSRRHRDAEPMSPADRRRSMRKKERINLGIGLGAACVGVALIFLSRDPSAILPESMVKDAEFTLIVWAVAHFLVAAFFVGAVIHRRRNHSGGDDPPVTKNREREHLLERGLRRLAPWVIKGTVVIIPLALLLSVGGFIADPHVETETDETKFVSQNLPAIQDYRTLEEVSSGFVSANLLIEAEDVTDPAILSWMLQVEQGINSGLPDEITGTSSIAALLMQATGGVMPQSAAEVKAVLSMLPEQTTSNYIDDDFTAANVVLGVEVMESGLDIEGIKQLKSELEGYVADPPQGVDVAVTGMLMLEVELWSAITGGRITMTLIGVGLIFAGLLLFFRFNLIRALLCTLPVGLIIGWSTGLMYVAGLKFNPATATIGALIMGIGVEFTILLMMRYYEERGRGETPKAAMTTAMTKIGRAIGVSGLTTMGGFAALMVAVDFPILRDFGILTVTDVFFALLSTLLVLAPLIVWVDSALDRRRRRKRRVARTRGQKLAAQTKSNG